MQNGWATVLVVILALVPLAWVTFRDQKQGRRRGERYVPRHRGHGPVVGTFRRVVPA